MTNPDVVVPFICSPPTTQLIDHSSVTHSHFSGLELADSPDTSDIPEVDVLIGSTRYWNSVTQRVIRGDNGPTAIHVRVGWILSGPVNQSEVTTNLTFTTTHVLKVETCTSLEGTCNFDDHLKQFWELESLEVTDDKTSMYKNFVQQIEHNGQRYDVSMRWKEHHPLLPNHYYLCHRHLINLLR